MDEYTRTAMMKAPETLAADKQPSSTSVLSTIAICGIIIGGLFFLFLSLYLLSRVKSKHRLLRSRRSKAQAVPSILEAGEKVVVEEETGEMDGKELETWLRRRSIGRFSDTGINLYGSFTRTPFEDWPSVRSGSSLHLRANANPSRPTAPPLNDLFAPSMSSESTKVNYSTQPHDIKPGLPKIFMASQYPCVRSVSNPAPRNGGWMKDRTMHRRPRCRPRSNSLGSNFVPSHSFAQSASNMKIPAPPSRALTADGMRAGWDIPSWVPPSY